MSISDRKPGQVTTASIGNQRITLVTPLKRACTKNLVASLSSIATHHGTKLRFLSATLSIQGGKRATIHHLPATITLPNTGLHKGSHQLTALVKYSGHQSKTLKATFRVC